jgi:integrase
MARVSEQNKRNQKPKPQRRQKGEGTKVSRHKASGRFYARVDLGVGSDGQRKRITIYGETEQEVMTKRDEVLVAHRRGTLAQPEKITLGEWLEAWLERQKPHFSERTHELYGDTLRLYVPNGLRQMRLQAIKRRHLSQLADDLSRRELSVSTRTKVFQHLRSAFEEAIERELLMVNPARTRRIRVTHSEKNARPQRDEKALTEEERDRFLEAAINDPLYPLFYTMFCLGTRRNEALGLRWQDLDFEQQSANIVQGIKIVHGKAVIGSLKNPHSRRNVPISDDLMQVLEVRRASQRRDRETLEDAWTENGLVFTTALGTPIHPCNVNRSIRAVIARANIETISVRGLHPGLPLERHVVHGFTLRTPVLARALDVSANTIRVIRREHGELIEGRHWVLGERRYSGQPVQLWTRAGALAMAALLGSDRSKPFRQALEVFVLTAEPLGSLRRFASHAGRYTFISLQRMQGVALEVIAAQTGHARLSTLLDHYRTIYPEEKRAAVYSIAQSQNRRDQRESVHSPKIGRKLGRKRAKKLGRILKKVRP